MHLRSPLLEVSRVVRRPELLLAPERCDEIYCDNTGLRPVLRSRFCRVWGGQGCLFHWQAGDSPPWCSLSEALEEVRNEGFPQRLFRWDEGIPNVGGDPLHQLPLMLE